MKQFLLFAGHDYYPSGGWEDFCSSHDSIEEAQAELAQQTGAEWAHIVNRETQQVVIQWAKHSEYPKPWITEEELSVWYAQRSNRNVPRGTN